VAAERAYLLLSGGIASEGAEPRPADDKRRNIPIRVAVRFKNYGKSPAILHHIAVDVWSQTDPVYRGRSLVWFPQDEQVISVGEESREIFRFLRMKPEDFELIFDEDVSVFCSFGIAYDDVFGERHETVMLGKFYTGWMMFGAYPNKERNRRT